MRLGWFASPVAHAIALAAAIVVWPRALPDLNAESAVVPIDIVTLSAVSNVTAVAPPAPPEEVEVQVEEKGAPTPAAPPVEEVAEAIPDKAAPAKPPPKKTEKKPSQRVDLDQLALLIDRSQKTPGQKEERTAPKAAPGEKPRKGFGAQDANTAALQDLLRAQLEKCWTAPVDAPNPERLIVGVHIKLNRDGSLSGVPQVVSPASISGGDTFMRVAAEKAVRAVRLCAPYELPQDSYASWREIDFTFDPREMSR